MKHSGLQQAALALVGVGVFIGGYGVLATLSTYNRVRRRPGMPVIVFEDFSEDVGYFRFKVVEGTVLGVSAPGVIELSTLEQAMEVVASIPPEQIQSGDRLFLRTVLRFSRMPRRQPDRTTSHDVHPGTAGEHCSRHGGTASQVEQVH